MLHFFLGSNKILQIRSSEVKRAERREARRSSRIISDYGFDNSTGAQELLALTCDHYERLLASIRSRLGEGGD